MAKKKNETVEELITTDVVELIELSESEQIVACNAELEQIKKDVADSRANFVAQTDKQIARIVELDVEISTKSAKAQELTDLIEITYPAEREKFIAFQNETAVKLGEAESRISSIEKREKDVEKALAEISETKSLQDTRQNDLAELSKSLNDRELELKKK